MTEDQACVTQCCGGDGCGYVHPDDNIRYCLGSGCMGWRWSSGPLETADFYAMGRVPEGEGWRCVLSDEERSGYTIKSRWERDVPRHGFCGLAGKP